MPDDYSPDDRDESADSGDEALLKEIRDSFDEFSGYWQDIRKERQTDLRYVCGQAWDPADLKMRQELGRPAINHDQLGQYINATVNNARQNPRAIKLEPAGKGSDANTADFRQQMIRGIEYKSKATQAYLRAYQDMVEGSYGFIRIGRRYVSNDIDGPDDQEITISAVMNPDSILYDPHCKEPDWSDAKRVFVLDVLPTEVYKARYPDAKVRDFGSAYHYEVASRWFTDKTVLVCEYWRVETKPVWNRRHTRKIERKKVIQYLTNGLEILERTEQPGCYIPVVPFIGLERWVDSATLAQASTGSAKAKEGASAYGGESKRMLFSLIRLARDPQMSLAYLVSQQMEEAGISPKVPYLGYVGQFETDRTNWQNASRQPYPYLQIDPIPDGANGQILPLPQRIPFTPNFPGYEVAKDSCQRAVQAAMGISPLPTATQRANEKSGIALERIESMEALGSYHFVDGFDRALEFAGRIINEWIPVVYDGERDIALRKPDDKHEVVRINTELPYLDPQSGQMRRHQIDQQGDHDVTVTTGPSYQSQHEAEAAFVDALLPNLTQLAGIFGPQAVAKIWALAIQIRLPGPKGEEIAEIINPESANQAGQAQQQIAGMQQKLQESQMLIQALQAELQKLQVEKSGKIVDNQARMAIERMKIEAQLAVAEIQTKSQMLSERASFINDLYSQLHQQAHEAQQATQQQQHEAMLQGMDQAHEAGMAASQPQPQPANGSAPPA